jgi:carboxyl-terminal processing protease
VILISFIAIFAISVASFGQTPAPTKTKERTDVYHDLEIFTKILEKVSQNYVDEVDTHELMKKAIEGMLSDLDPHSQYLDGLEYEDLMVSTRGEFGGLGILISFRDNYPTVMSPIDGTPAERAGVRGGDQIVEIEGVSTAGWTVDKAVGMLRGEPGTKVTFRIRHPGQDDSTEYTLVREVINVSTVPYQGMVKEGVGYMRVSNFAQKTAQEMEEALANLEGKGMRALILDFRSNPGGLLQTATEVSELFLEKDKLLVYTKGRLANSNRKYYSANRHVHGGYPIIVMVNGNSASASEIFAGAMQDWDAAFVVGQTSFGKGTVQTVFKLSDTEAVKLTTAKYYTPSGRSIHKDENDHPEDADLVAMNDGGGEVEDDLTPEDAPDLKTDAKSQEIKGVKDAADKPVYYTSSGRVVYGGGGITPDLEFVPKEYTDLQRRLEKDYLGFSFAHEFLKNHEITQDFKTTDAVLNDFYKFLGTKKFEYKKDELTPENVDYIRTMVAREAVNAKFGRNAMYRVVVDADPEVQEVVKLLDKHPTLKSLFSYAEEQKGAVKKADKPDAKKTAPTKK